MGSHFEFVTQEGYPLFFYVNTWRTFELRLIHTSFKSKNCYICITFFTSIKNMQKFKNLYIAATSQHVGKTTSTLGLVSACLNKEMQIGYCKPVGQKALDIKNLRVDKDAVLFSEMIHFELNPDLHSPVILGKGATTNYLDNPAIYDYERRLTHATKSLNDLYELTIFEGTGHPGVGSVVNLSNADVAKRVNAGVVMVVEGGIGNTIDLLALNFSLFRAQNVPIIGVIVNKVLPDKMERVRHYVGAWLKTQNIPLLGILPYDKSLGYPILKTVVHEIEGTVHYNDDMLANRVAGILGSSVMDTCELPEKEDLLLIVSMRRINQAIETIQKISENLQLTKSPLSGIIATAEGTLTEASIAYIQANRIPFIRSKLDTYGIVIRFDNLEVKINPQTPWKVERAINMIREYVDLELILEKCTL